MPGNNSEKTRDAAPLGFRYKGRRDGCVPRQKLLGEIGVVSLHRRRDVDLENTSMESSDLFYIPAFKRSNTIQGTPLSIDAYRGR
jgi:hypothetical protein